MKTNEADQIIEKQNLINAFVQGERDAMKAFELVGYGYMNTRQDPSLYDNPLWKAYCNGYNSYMISKGIEQ